MRIGMLGVGAIGGVIGGYLARAGNDVTLIDLWPDNIERIKSHGLTVTALEEEFTVKPRALHLGEVSASRSEFDTVMLSVKSFDTGWASALIAPYLAPGGFIVSSQNSINEETIASVVGWSRVVGYVITLGAAMYEPGRAERTSDADRPAFALGEPSGIITPRIEELARVLSAVGPTRTTSNLWGERWSKLATNCMSNAVAGFTGLSSAGLRDNVDARALGIRIATETVDVATAWGVKVEPIAGIPAEMFSRSVDDKATKKELEDRWIEGGKGLGTGRPSLAQDVIKGRKTEVGSLNGYVVRKGEEIGVPTPVNRAVVELTRQLEAGDLEPSLTTSVE